MYRFQGKGENCNLCFNSMAAQGHWCSYYLQKLENGGFIVSDCDITQKPLCFPDTSYSSF